MTSVRIDHGGMWEETYWDVEMDYECSSLGGGKPCKHCNSEGVNEHGDKTWICPSVVVAYNEGRNNSTGICLQCIQEAIESMGKG